MPSKKKNDYAVFKNFNFTTYQYYLTLQLQRFKTFWKKIHT